MDELAIILQQKLMGAWVALDGQHKHSAWAEHTHACCGLVSSSDAIQLVTRPDANNGAHSKVAVNDGRTVQGIKGHTEARSTDIHWLRHLLGAGQLHDVGVAAGLEQQLVCHHIHSQLLIAEGVHASSASAGGGADLVSDGADALGQGGHQRPELDVLGGVDEELVQGVTQLGLCLHCGPAGCTGSLPASCGLPELGSDGSALEGGGSSSSTHNGHGAAHLGHRGAGTLEAGSLGHLLLCHHCCHFGVASRTSDKYKSVFGWETRNFS
mmetsp:Transcript_14913/g.40219  ORF Transcript_14913/g.40219 Transcript_14913/m.40219 type:complete len:268 (+) Transcript_14913:867-1670(+)